MLKHNSMDNDDDLINAVEDDDEEEQEQKLIERLRRSPRIPVPNKRYEKGDQEPEQEIIKAITTKTKKAKPDKPI